MESNPKVSIVIPVYNGSNFLSEAIDSALGQTYGNVEVLIINDGSTDNGETERIALSYGDKISYYSKKNGGVASALNFGVRKMTGEYFSWLSHDDLYEKTKVEEEVGCLLAQHDLTNTIIASNSSALFENGIKRKEAINKSVFDDHFTIFLGASARVGLNGCSLLIPRRLLTKNKFREDLPVTQDYDLWYRLRRKAKFVLLARNLVVYRHHDMQDSIQKFDISLIAGDDLRSGILQDVSKVSFAEFMAASKENEKWIWKNYATYKSRGHIKTALAILYLLGNYYDHESMNAAKVKSEVVAFDRKIAGHYVHDIDDTAAKARALIKSISNKDYENRQSPESSNRIVKHIESIKNEGLLFFAERVLRKLVSILRRR